MAGILLQTAILMGTILLVLRRWTLPPGTITMLFTLNVALISVLADQYRLIPAAVAAGIVGLALSYLLVPPLGPIKDKEE